MTLQHDLREARCERACWWLAQGVEVVPLKPHSKELQPGYGARKAHIATTAFARQWFLNTEANLGIVLGGAGGLVVGDWDSDREYEAWRNTTGKMVDTLIERTSRGYHVYFIGYGLISAAGSGCELKTRGICMVSPSVHPSGTVYHIAHDAPIATLDSQRAAMLFPFLSDRLGEQAVWAISTGERWPGNQRRQASGVVARIKAACSVMDEMSAVGIKFQHGGKTTLVARCPFHRDHSPSLWVNPEAGVWGCNRPDCPATGTHDVINFRALYRGISNRAAIKQLAAEYLASESTSMR